VRFKSCGLELKFKAQNASRLKVGFCC